MKMQKKEEKSNYVRGPKSLATTALNGVKYHRLGGKTENRNENKKQTKRKRCGFLSAARLVAGRRAAGVPK